MPDLSILVELADFHGVELRELLDGEGRAEKMNEELEQTVLKVADYSNEEKQKLAIKMHRLFIAGLVSFVIYFVTLFIGTIGPRPVFDFVQGFTLSFAFAMMLFGVVTTSKYAAKIRAHKKRLTAKR